MNKKTRVFITKCRDYPEAETKIADLIALAGGIETLVSAGEAILLKPNLLLPCRPERAVTTHPAIVAAMARQLLAAGARVTVADSPGAGLRFTSRALERIYRSCGLTQALEGLDVTLNLDTNVREVSNRKGGLVRRFEVMAPAAESDGIISLSKLKTHMFMHMTGAVKNSFGLIPGLKKAGFHASMSDTRRFAGMLLDLDALAAPRFHVMDAVLAMEGDGPGTSGTPRHLGLLMASRSALALDIAASAIIGMDEAKNPVIAEAAARGLFPSSLDHLEIVGPAIESLCVTDFKVHPRIETGTGMSMVPGFIRSRVERLLKNNGSLRPWVAPDRCVACGVCETTCPVDAVRIEDRSAAVIDEARCIRCYCCHEMCDSNAVILKKSLLYRVLSRF